MFLKCRFPIEPNPTIRIVFILNELKITIISFSQKSYFLYLENIITNVITALILSLNILEINKKY